jgi:hypothetical protein
MVQSLRTKYDLSVSFLFGIVNDRILLNSLHLEIRSPT